MGFLTDFNLFAEVDWIRDSPFLGLSAFGLLFDLSFLVAMFNQRINQSTLQLVLAHAIFIPLFTWGTLWCYEHPERLAVTPDAWHYDMRPLWLVSAVLDAVLLMWFFKGKR